MSQVINGVTIADQYVNALEHVDPSKVHIGPKQMSKDDFMKVFLAQISMQNPLKPMDNADMLNQMAQMTSISASEDLKKTIDGMNVNLVTDSMVSATQLVHHKVLYPSDQAQLIENEGLSGSVLVTKPTKDITITIKDDKGNVVKTIQKEASSQGLVDFEWDGKINDTDTAKPGFYTVSADATIDGKKTALKTATAYRISSVALNRQNGAIILNLDGHGAISIDDVVKFL